MDIILVCKRADKLVPGDQLATTHGGMPSIPVVAVAVVDGEVQLVAGPDGAKFALDPGELVAVTRSGTLP